MKLAVKSHIVALIFVLNSISFSWAGIDSMGKDAPPELVERAKQLVAQKDYNAIEGMIAQIDTQYASDHGQDYFRALMGIWRTLGGWKPYPAEPDYARIWLSNKIHWKLLFTPYSRIEDARSVQRMRDGIAGFAAPSPLDGFDRDHFVAMRNDAFAMLVAYRDSLRARIIPNYQYKPGHTPMSIGVGGTAAETWRAKRAAEEPQLTKNDHENDEQDALMESLQQLQKAAISLIKETYSWPPEDDPAVNEILNSFPPTRETGETRESVISFLTALRRHRLGELKALEEKRKALQGKAP